MRAASLAIALALGAGMAAGLAVPSSCGAFGWFEPVHPGFSLARRDLTRLVSGLPEADRTLIAARPRGFLELMRGALLGPQDLLVLVDKRRALAPEFAPGDLVDLSRFALRTGKPDLRLRAVLIPDLSAMSEAAAAAGAPLVISSAWRSYQYQEELLQRALANQSREEAERTLAPPGHSQHQLGTAVDFGSIDLSFARTAAGRWLLENAWRFGFSLSYPEGQDGLTGYSWEPWHYRYVGKAAAQLIQEFFGGRQQEFLAFYAEKSGAFAEKLRR
jgi:D-alanyl-D-alanine carboxypeptidase